MRRILFFGLLSLTLFGALAQSESTKNYSHIDYQLIVDNDVFAGDVNQDQYYTSGIIPGVRLLMDSLGSTKVIRTYQFNHIMYTPSDVRWRLETSLDRPYAGLIYATVGNEYYFSSGKYLKVNLNLGIMGPASGVGSVQKAYHQLFGMPEPRGWKYQMNNSPVINLDAKYMKLLKKHNDVEIITESDLSLGTIYNFVRQNVVFRFGTYKPLHQSALTAATLGSEKPSLKSKRVEFYGFYSPGLELVFYNATIQGNFIGTPSEYPMKLVPVVIQHRFGVMFSYPRFDFGATLYFRTKENVKAHYHKYVGIRFNQRF